ncbi:MAG: aminopeptidase, partial [Muribaculaceae bacterium]|nr:aminopeptidase [Muribaculaceae bacterium]
AMTLVGVDLDANGKPASWLIENSWGPGANDGHLLATDSWMDEYMFRLVVERKYLPEATLKLLEQKPLMLPAWDFMFMNEE